MGAWHTLWDSITFASEATRVWHHPVDETKRKLVTTPDEGRECRDQRLADQEDQRPETCSH